jgi:hypothetical protein
MTTPGRGYDVGVLQTAAAIAFAPDSIVSGTNRELGLWLLKLACASRFSKRRIRHVPARSFQSDVTGNARQNRLSDPHYLIGHRNL